MWERCDGIMAEELLGKVPVGCRATMRVAVGSQSPRELSVQRAPRRLPEIEITKNKNPQAKL